MIFAAYKLVKLGAKNVLIKGGHFKFKSVQERYLLASLKLKCSTIEDIKQKILMEQVALCVQCYSYHFLSCGKPIKKACELGIKYVNSAINNKPKIWKRTRSINHLYSMKLDKKFK